VDPIIYIYIYVDLRKSVLMWKLRQPAPNEIVF